MEIKVSLIRLIYNILNESLEARDNWMLTIKEVHTMEMRIKGISKQDYFEHFFNDDLSNVHTIKRLWQKVQEEFPNLRGKTWAERQKQGGQYVVDSLKIDKSQMTLFTSDELHDITLLNNDN